MIGQCVFSILSDIIMVISTIILISGFGVNKISNTRNVIKALVIICVLSLTIFITYPLEINFLSFWLYPIMFGLAYKFIYLKLNFAQIYIAILSEFIVYLFSSTGTFIVMQLTSDSFDLSNKISLCISRVIYLVIAILISSSPRTKKLYIISKDIPKYIWFLIILSLICVSSISDLNCFPTINPSKELIVTIFVFLLVICLISIVFSLLINVASKNYYTALNSLLEKQVATQISHYEKLEKLNSDMRTFRHDYINHLSSINALIGEGCYSDAQKYIDKLTESTHRNEAIYLTGNRLADAILTDKSDSCKDFADIEFDGCITDKIENSDICIILANSLDNAIEACKKCPKRGKISIAAQIRQGYWTMTMRNPTVSSDSEGIMKTSKEDEKNHGFGLLSIEKAVKKYDGTMAVSIKDGMFEMAVVMKIPVEN